MKWHPNTNTSSNSIHAFARGNTDASFLLNKLCVHENQNRRAPFPADSRHYRKRVLVEYREQINISVCRKCEVVRKKL